MPLTNDIYAVDRVPGSSLLYSDLPTIDEIAIWYDSHDRSSGDVTVSSDSKKATLKSKEDSLAKSKE